MPRCIGFLRPSRRALWAPLRMRYMLDGIKKDPHPERLSWQSSGLPWFLVSQDGVEDGEEFSHASGDGDFGRFAGGAQPLIGMAERQLVANGDHDRHKEGGAHRAAATGDGASAPEGTAIAVEGSQPGKAGDFAAVEGAPFGYFCDQRTGDGVADRRHACEQVLLLAPCRTAAAPLVDVLLDLTELGLQHGQDTLQAAPHARLRQVSTAIAFSPNHLDDLAAPGDQF